MAGPQMDPRHFADLARALQTTPGSEETAEEVLAFGRQQLDADYAGITLITRGGRLETVAATDDVVRKVDALEYELGEGACRDRSWHGEALKATDLRSDPRWPRWGPRAAEVGVVSVLAAELSGADDRRVGALNLYWSHTRTFSRDDVAYVDILGRHAAVALVASLEQEGLRVALDARKLIGQAQGILMERFKLNEAQAFAVLRRYSQDHNVKLRQIAQFVVSTRRLPSSE